MKLESYKVKSMKRVPPFSNSRIDSKEDAMKQKIVKKKKKKNAKTMK